MSVTKKTAAFSATLLLCACSTIRFQPTATISQVRIQEGYRLQNALDQSRDKEDIVIMMFSGGGTRAAAFGYGVLEELDKHPIRLNGKYGSLLDNVDVAYGVSGGSVLATYFALHGKDTIPSFETRFLKQNFQRQIIRQFLSIANLPKLSSPEYGRGDLLQEQFENALFGSATFGDLTQNRKGPFAVISATDMTAGWRLDFTQENFDMLCLNLAKLKLARAVAASSAVPVVFSPITLNNNAGNCHYTLPQSVQQAVAQNETTAPLRNQTRRELIKHRITHYGNGKHPYLHLLDGGLTDNLGLRHLLDMNEIYQSSTLKDRFIGSKTKRIIIIAVNAQNQIGSTIDQSATIPRMRDAITAIIDVPISQQSQGALRRFRTMIDDVNANAYNTKGEKVQAYFISLNLQDLPESPLRDKLLNIPTTFYLPEGDIAQIKSAAPILLKQSPQYQQLLQDLAQENAKTAGNGRSHHAPYDKQTIRAVAQ